MILAIDWGGALWTLWEFVISIINFTGDLWDWLNSSIVIGTTTVSPLGLFGGTVLFTLLVAFLVKTFVPFV